jgi:hypothetical protein
MDQINRRSFLATTSFAVGLAMQTLSMLGTRSAAGNFNSTNGVGYGPLRPAKSHNTGETLLALPEGFEYTVIGRTGAKMSDGHLTPPAHDGMAAFNLNGQLRLVRNHEVNNGIGRAGAAFGDGSQAYDGTAAGGTTTLIIDPKTREIVRDFASLNGTLQNCAGGPTPWGSWISCEETTLGRDKITDSTGRTRGGFEQSHGYCFEVPARSDQLVRATPIKGMGRFVHEAVAVDARTGIVYETEDAGSAGFYRFIPEKRGVLSAGGRLQMLAVTDHHKCDLRSGRKQGQTYDVHWVDIANPDPADAHSNPRGVYQQGFDRNGATFARLEGCWYGQGSIYFTSTSGGDKKLGQVWQYRPQGRDRGLLTLIYESSDANLLEMPDNLCVSPRGALVLCEDGRTEQYVRGLTLRGQIFDLARNLVPGYETREFAGATFSPDGQTLFVNVQTPGVTFAIWGPWKKGAL